MLIRRRALLIGKTFVLLHGQRYEKIDEAKTMRIEKIKINYILAACMLALLVVCFLSIYQPIRFDEQKAVREQAVKERLVKIRQAEESYRKAHGTYAGQFDTLVKEGFLADSLTRIPFSADERFELTATVEIMKSGRQVPLMECGAQYHQYLEGLDENTIANLMETADNEGRYPGLRIGDITQNNHNAGNWE